MDTGPLEAIQEEETPISTNPAQTAATPEIPMLEELVLYATICALNPSKPINFYFQHLKALNLPPHNFIHFKKQINKLNKK